MKTLIKATAPTHYQYNSLRAFNLDKSNKCPYSSEMIGYSLFDTLKQARAYLKKQAERYYDNDRKKIKENLSKWGLIIDNVDATILTGEEYLSLIHI